MLAGSHSKGGSTGAPVQGRAPSPWPRLPSTPRLALGEAHVVQARLDRSPAELDAICRFLCPPEMERARRFRRVRDARRSMASRGLLRVLLGRYLNRAPGGVELVVAEGGKPLLLRDGIGGGELHFNVSHCEGLALYAFTRVAPVGVDIEALRSTPDIEGLAERFFSPGEADELLALEAGLRPLGFFHCWTRKEAILKATGEGLFRELSSFDVTLRPGEAARLLRWPDGTQREQWTLRHLAPASDHVGALAVRGVVSRLRCWTWAGPDRHSA